MRLLAKYAALLLFALLVSRLLHAACAPAPALNRVGAAEDGVLAAVAEYCDATGAAGAVLGLDGEAPVGITILCPAGAEQLADAYTAQKAAPTLAARPATGGI
ncbi:MAG: hypothetical protein SF182_01535 [Deltaproteobacteria bacterium]|nr:hypothetical protein [Deltaproteobacteria bacterium]